MSVYSEQKKTATQGNGQFKGLSNGGNFTEVLNDTTTKEKLSALVANFEWVKNKNEYVNKVLDEMKSALDLGKAAFEKDPRRGNPEDCSKTSIVQAAIYLTETGLSYLSKEVYLYPSFYSTFVAIPTVNGLKRLAYESGVIKNFSVSFYSVKGLEANKITHEYKPLENYCDFKDAHIFLGYLELTNGIKISIIKTKDYFNKVKGLSKGSTAWANFEEEMCLSKLARKLLEDGALPKNPKLKAAVNENSQEQELSVFEEAPLPENNAVEIIPENEKINSSLPEPKKLTVLKDNGGL
jgi:hypothetical protein